MEKITWKNLAPLLTRQRLIIEGTTKTIVRPEKIKGYLSEIANVAEMNVINGPFVYSAHEMGFGGWIHWKTSGANFYSYPTEPPLFTVDIYSCKIFSEKKVIKFTSEYFSPLELVFMEVEV